MVPLKIRNFAVGFLFALLVFVPSLGAKDQGPLDFPGLEKADPNPQYSLKSTQDDWYKDQNFYHVWMAAFCDSNGDGIGDIPGVTSKLDYLKSLGITALWLSPIFQNASGPGNLHGYDVTDLYKVDSRFGTLDDVKELLAQAHKRGMRVIFDYVPNHLSNQSPWFLDSKADKNGKRDWFLWKKEAPSTGWTNWNGQSAWRYAGSDKNDDDQFYYAIFWEGMPDLNYLNPEVRTAMADAAVYWLNQGFDGLRVDAVRYLIEDPVTGENGVTTVYPRTVEFFQNFRAQVLDPYAKLGYAKFMVAENWTEDRKSLTEFQVKEGKKGFHMTLDFPFGPLDYSAVAGNGFDLLVRYWQKFVVPLQDQGGWTGTFLTNHDNYQSRPLSAFDGNRAQAVLAAVLQFTGPGTPFWYTGNEAEMEAVMNGDDKRFRKPVPWAQVAGFQKDPQSVWTAAAALMKLRQERVSLRRGTVTALTTDNPAVHAFIRTLDKEKTLVVVHTEAGPARAEIAVEGLTAAQLLRSSSELKVSASGGKVTLDKLGPWGYAVVDLSTK